MSEPFDKAQDRQDAAEKQAEELCAPEKFHELYEKLAPYFGYETRTETRQFDRQSKNGKLMVAVCGEIAAAVAAALRSKDSVIRALSDMGAGYYEETLRLEKERDEARQAAEQAAERQRALENAIVILTKHNGWDLMMNDAEYRLVKEVKNKYTILAQDVKE